MRRKYSGIKIRVLMGMIGLLTVMSSSSVYAQDHKPEINAVEIILHHVHDSY